MTYSSTYGGSMLPSSWNNDNTALGAFIAANKGTYSGNAVSSWSEWRQAYAAFCSTSTEYNSSSAKTATTLDGYQYSLVSAWKSQIQIEVASGTTIIGLTAESGIKGGNISISGVSNVVIRNLHLQDAFDPFPHHEDGDGWNAEYDCITIQNTNSHIWIDHCTFEDTVSVGWTNFAGVNIGTVGTGGDTQAYSESDSGYEMWQTYDGLCDIKGKSTNITVSYCVFKNHDKTMLIGSSDTEYTSITDSGRTITLHHNYFDSCVQRLPMVRTSYIHIYNNYFGYTSNGYDQKASIQVRAMAQIISEYNYFDTGIKYRYKGDNATSKVKINKVETDKTSETLLYDSNNDGVSSTTGTYWTSKDSAPFSVPYTYTTDATNTLADNLKSNAGAGVWTVQQ